MRPAHSERRHNPVRPAVVRRRNDGERFSHLKRSLKSVKDLYDFIIIDTPSAIGVVLKTLLAAVNYVIIPAEESGWSPDGLMDFANAL